MGIGGFDLVGSADRIIAFDYAGTGRLDHLVCYRPGKGAVFIVKKVNATGSPNSFAAVYSQGDPGSGIGGFDFTDSRDRLLGFDYDGTGKLDHLVCYRPGTGVISILKKLSDADSPDAFAPVYHGNGIGGFDLLGSTDQIIAYDYASTGRLDHLVCYRPGKGAVYIVQKVNGTDSPGAFAAVYHQGDGGQGIGGFNPAAGQDRLLAFDYDGTGKLDHLVCYRPGKGAVVIAKKVNGTDNPGAFAAVYQQGDGGQGIGGFDLAGSTDQVMAYDYAGTGRLDHLLCYRPGTGAVFIVQKVNGTNSPGAFAGVYHQGQPGSGIGGFPFSDSRDLASAFDYDGTGKLDHLVCYRPGTGMISILQKLTDADSPDAFKTVYPALFGQVVALFGALPDQGANVAGGVAHAALVNRVTGVTPTVTFVVQPANPRFAAPSTFVYRDRIFSGWVADPNAGQITPATGLDDNWWTGFNVVLICQAIYYLTSNLRPYVKQPDVSNQVAALNDQLLAKIGLFYAGIVAAAPGPIEAAFAQIAPYDRPEAATFYVGLLEDPVFIEAKIGQATSGSWADQLWELLHHWVKLYALGMTAAQIDAVIATLVTSKLPVPDVVGAGKWPSYVPWLNPVGVSDHPGTINYEDLQVAQYVSANDYVVSVLGDFLQNPGGQWSTLYAPSSCFGAGAKVLMADGTFKTIETIRPGEMVQSIAGPRPVIAAVSLRHQGERLYGFAGIDLRFSATHPFLTAAGASGGPGASAAGVDPMRLMRAMPGLSSRGIARLGAASCPPLAGYAGGVRPVQPGALQEHPVTPGTEMIYDLITAFDAEGVSQYCVGDGHTTFAVTSEVPRFATAPAAAAAIMDIVTAALPTIVQAMQPVPAALWHRVLDGALHDVAVGLTPAVAGADPAAALAAAPGGWGTGPSLAAAAHGFAAGLMSGGAQANVYANDRGACFAAIVAHFGNLVRDWVATGWRAFPAAGTGPLLAVTALSFEVAGSDAPSGAGAVTAEMVIGDGKTATRHVLPALPSNGQPLFFHQIGDVAYIPRPASRRGAGIPLRIAFRDGERPLPLRGIAWLPDMSQRAYCAVKVPLLEGAGDSLIVGQFLIDLRLTDEASRAAETASHADWTPERETRFAHALGQRIGARLVAAFPGAVAALTQ